MAAKGGRGSRELVQLADSCGEEELCYSPSPQRVNCPEDEGESSPCEDEGPSEDSQIAVSSPLPPEEITGQSESIDSTSTSEPSPVKANDSAKHVEERVASKRMSSPSKEVEIDESKKKQTQRRRSQRASKPSSVETISAKKPVKKSSSDKTSVKSPSPKRDEQSQDTLRPNFRLSPSLHSSPAENGEEEKDMEVSSKEEAKEVADDEDAAMSGVDDAELAEGSEVASDEYLSEVDGVHSDDEADLSDLSDSEASYIEIDGDDQAKFSSNDESYDRPLSLNAEEEGEASQMWKGRSARRPPPRDDDRRRQGASEPYRRSEMSARRREFLDRERERWRRERDARDRDARRDIERRRDRREEDDDEEDAYSSSLRRRKRGGRRERLRRLYKRLDRVEQRRLDAEELRELERRREIVRRRLDRENARWDTGRGSRSGRHADDRRREERRYVESSSRHHEIVRHRRSSPPSYRARDRERVSYRPRSPARYERDRPPRRREYESPPRQHRYEDGHRRSHEQAYSRRHYREPSPRRHPVYEASSRRRSSPRRRPPSPRRSLHHRPRYTSPPPARRPRRDPSPHRPYHTERHRPSESLHRHSSSRSSGDRLSRPARDREPAGRVQRRMVRLST